MEKHNLVISLLVYNQLEVTKKCIESLLVNTTSSDFILVISDNASRKDTEDYLRYVAKSNKNVVYVRNNENIGYISAHNNIFRDYPSKYFCVLNNDLIIKTNGWDRNYLDILKSDNTVAQVGRIQEFGYINSLGIGEPRGYNKSLDYIEGSCFVAVSDYISKAGGLFEDHYLNFAFCEDADLSLRLRSRGYNIVESNVNDIVHLHNQSFKNEKLSIDFKKLEKQNRKFLTDRWQKYLRTRNFEPLNILVKRQGAIGDTLCTEPILRELNYKYFNCNISVDTACPEALSYLDYLEDTGKDLKNIFTYDFEIDLDAAYESDPTTHIVDAYAYKANVILQDKLPRYNENISWKGKNSKSLVVNSEGSWSSRTLNKDKWKNFILYLRDKLKYNIIEVGRDPASYLGLGENKVGKLSLPATLELMSSCKMYVGFDGGLMHFAQSIGLPVFIVFGCTCPNYRIHDWDKAKVVWLDKTELECAGCHHTRPSPRFYTECDKDHVHCLENISMKLLIDTFVKKKFGEKTIPICKERSTRLSDKMYSVTTPDIVVPLNLHSKGVQHIAVEDTIKITAVHVLLATYLKDNVSCVLNMHILDKAKNIIYSEEKQFNVNDNSWQSFNITKNLYASDDICIIIQNTGKTHSEVAMWKDPQGNLAMIIE